MKLYKIVSPPHVFEDGTVVEPEVRWEGTQATARAARIDFEVPFKDIKPAKRPKVTVDEIDVPTDKQGLLAWLNENAV